MKTIFAIFCTILLSAFVFAQSPEKLSYQAVIRDTGNILVKNQTIEIQISILQGSVSGTAVYVETQTPATNSNGLVSIEIGGGTVVSGDFTAIDWATGPYFIKTETDPDGTTGGVSYSITGTSQLLSVPYALYAEKAGTATGGGNFSHYIGEQYGGGVIFHLWKDNTGTEHGLVLALVDQGSSQTWSNITSTMVGISAQSPWDGLNNSNAIVAQSGHTTSAAKLCLDLVSGGQSDWYLPGIQELNMLCGNYYTISRALANIPGATQLAYGNYWSSSECSASTAHVFQFDRTYTQPSSKEGICSVRAVRAF
ncbi:MAG: hypothetical protein A2W91_00745 [Bacteroidetes bacterium GWF2_38_335]|nr:MAG: hypothetical protein A2W91_00745 [Bacteroidetes bacterium GWF2_38_335]OFY78360.1 MAG: hypothetical protein A2281_04125 [Bacteroidetes bacterium RIFOXYA12_FULL_38_20]HBS87443.1 hypothetical protein [Bacteroidales bacterium]